MRYLFIILLIGFCFGQEKKVDRKTEIENQHKQALIELNQLKISVYDATKSKENATKIIEQATKEKFTAENYIFDAEKKISEIAVSLKSLQDEYLKVTAGKKEEKK